MSVERPLSNLVLRNLMMEVMGDTEFCKSVSGKYDFFNAGGAHQDNLFWLVEKLATDKGLIDDRIPLNCTAWGAPRNMMYEDHSTNFYNREIEGLWEAFYVLLNNYIIAPGMYGNSPELPFFHITEHGKRCIDERDILPYDIDGYMAKLKELDTLDEWVEFYMMEALKCYNANCYNAATAMIGLSSEVLVERLIKGFSSLLGKDRYNLELKNKCSLSNDLKQSGKTLKDFFDDKTSVMHISTRYEAFNNFFESIKNLPNGILYIMDTAARHSFFTFIRLNRNEVSHCMEVKKDNTEVLLIFISFTKYCILMTQLINAIDELN